MCTQSLIIVLSIFIQHICVSTLVNRSGILYYIRVGVYSEKKNKPILPPTRTRHCVVRDRLPGNMQNVRFTTLHNTCYHSRSIQTKIYTYIITRCATGWTRRKRYRHLLFYYRLLLNVLRPKQRAISYLIGTIFIKLLNYDDTKSTETRKHVS